jgi:hypothetical protein
MVNDYNKELREGEIIPIYQGVFGLSFGKPQNQMYTNGSTTGPKSPNVKKYSIPHKYLCR